MKTLSNTEKQEEDIEINNYENKKLEESNKNSDKTNSMDIEVNYTNKIEVKNPHLLIRCFKWIHSFHNKQYYQFFDYSSKDIIITEFKTNKPEGTLIDNFTTISLLDNYTKYNNEVVIPNYENCNFLKENLTFALDKNKNYVIHNNHYSYISARYATLKNDLLLLKINTVIKIGKYLFKVIMFRNGNNIQIGKNSLTKYLDETSTLSLSNETSGQSYISSYQNSSSTDVKNINNVNSNEEDNSEKICKFCFSSETSENNQLVSVCKCSGSMKYIHVQCLNKWVHKKCKIRFDTVNPFVSKINVNKFYCEICKEPFPLAFYLNNINNNTDKFNNIFYLVDELKNKQNYLILRQSSYNGKEDNIENQILFLNMENYYKNEISIGRHANSILRLDNISVSRNHAAIFYDHSKNGFYIKDTGSKFGTLVYNDIFTNDIYLNDDLPNITIQKGNTVYNFSYLLDKH